VPVPVPAHAGACADPQARSGRAILPTAPPRDQLVGIAQPIALVLVCDRPERQTPAEFGALLT
jgi:hypothetical protein